MTTGAAIAQKINYGLGKAGSVLGFANAWYRPQGNGPVIVAANQLGTITAHITAKASLVPGPAEWGKSDRFGAFDATNVLSGDYLAGEVITFVTELPPLGSPIRLTLCNETFTWLQRGEAQPGPGYRGGAQPATLVAATGWPGWLNPTERRSAPELHLPGTVEMASAQILLPASLPGQPIRGDELETGEASPTRWTIQSAVQSPNGWQIVAIRAGA